VTPSDLAYIQQLVRAESAIVLDDSKAYLVDGRLAPLARSAGYASLAELVQHLRSQPVGALHQRVIEALATHETSFFRDPRVFHVLRTRTLPELLQHKRKLTIWSAACSTGQEPYSIAMSILEYFPDLPRGSVEIHASDLSEEVLNQARNGVYSRLELSRGLPPEFKERYFEAAGEHFRVKPRVRELVSFQRLNLAATWPVLPLTDMVLLRNVLIYLDQTTRTQILERTCRTMRMGAYLVLGTSETAIAGELFNREIIDGTVLYRLLRGKVTLPGMPLAQ
jgi:chemotaxis protein methyltransferase CheR